MSDGLTSSTVRLSAAVIWPEASSVRDDDCTAGSVPVEALGNAAKREPGPPNIFVVRQPECRQTTLLVALLALKRHGFRAVPF
jgi:hypothetical protein